MAGSRWRLPWPWLWTHLWSLGSRKNYTTASPVISTAAALAAIVIAFGVVVINRRAFRRVPTHRRTGGRVMEWTVIVALAALVGAMCMVVYDASRQGRK